MSMILIKPSLNNRLHCQRLQNFTQLLFFSISIATLPNGLKFLFAVGERGFVSVFQLIADGHSLQFVAEFRTPAMSLWQVSALPGGDVAMAGR